jgi:uncharacterized membrane protein
LVRMPAWMLLGLSAAILAAAVVAQTGLQTPPELSNAAMRNMHLEGGVLRLAAVEGQFPLLPWLALFATGFQTGKWIGSGGRQKILLLAVSVAGLGAGLVIAGQALPANAHNPLLARAFTLMPRIYPAYPPLILLLLSLALFLLLIVTHPAVNGRFTATNPLACVGRASLTVLLAHILIFREGSQRAGLFHAYSAATTMLVIMAVIALIAMAARKWRQQGFGFGLEWLLRKIAG